MKVNVNTKYDFERRVSTYLCHELNERCGQKWTMVELRKFLNSSEICYLNDIGRGFTPDRTKVNYMSAYYMLISPKEFITSTGEQLYLWCYRNNTNERFGKINIGVYEDFDYVVVKNHFTKTTKHVKLSKQH